MAKYLALLIGLLAVDVCADGWRPNDRLLHAVRFVESSHGQMTFGDNGQSLGDFQISEAAWIDVSAWRKAKGLKAYDYEEHVWDRRVNREYASNYMSILYGQLKKRLNRPPTASEVYAAYNMGMASFAQCRYRLAKVNPTTARKCEQIEALIQQK